MLIGYPILVKRDINSIISLWSPDFKKDYINNYRASLAEWNEIVGNQNKELMLDVVEKQTEEPSLREGETPLLQENSEDISQQTEKIIPSQDNELFLVAFLEKSLADDISKLEKGNFTIPNPSSLPDISEKTGEGSFWLKIYINIEKKNNFFARALPVLGSACNLIAAISGTIISILALKITLSENSSDEKSEEGIVYSGATVRFAMLLILYHFSEAKKYLALLGSKVDDLLARKKNYKDLLQTSDQETSIKTKVALIFSRIGLPLLAAADVTIQAITLYQEIIAISEKARTKHIDITPEVSQLLAIICTTSSSIAGLSFEESFAMKLLEKIEEKLTSTASLTREGRQLTR